MFVQLNKNATENTSDYSQHIEIVQLLESALKPKNGIISIPPFYRKKYEQFYSESYINYMRVSAILGPLLFFSIAIMDWLFLPESHVVMLIRLGLVMPILLIITLLSFTRFFIKLEQPLMITAVVVITLGILSIIYYVPLENKYFHLATLLIIQIVLFTLARIKFWYGVILILLIWLGANVILISISSPLEFFFERNLLFFSTSLLAIFTGFMMEQTTRRTFLQESLLELEKKYLLFANTYLQSIAILDSLTNIPNHRNFIVSLTEEWYRAARFNYPLALLMIDIDNFKQINDTYGHLCGDLCLQQFGKIIKNLIQRPGDVFARYGGDEFVVLLIATEREGAETIANLIQQAIKQLKIYSDDKQLIKISVSIGIGVISPSKENKPRKLIMLADEDLYRAKKIRK